MMLDSRTTSHLTSQEHKLLNSKYINVKITLADDSIITGTARGTREVHWQTYDGIIKIKLSNMIFIRNLSMSLLPIRSLGNKNITVLSLHGKALILDLEGNFKVLDFATKEEDCFFQRDDLQKVVKRFDMKSASINKSMMAAIKEHAMLKSNTLIQKY